MFDPREKPEWGTVEIDPTHPLSRSLVFACNFNEPPQLNQWRNDAPLLIPNSFYETSSGAGYNPQVIGGNQPGSTGILVASARGGITMRSGAYPLIWQVNTQPSVYAKWTSEFQWWINTNANYAFGPSAIGGGGTNPHLASPSAVYGDSSGNLWAELATSYPASGAVIAAELVSGVRTRQWQTIAATGFCNGSNNYVKLYTNGALRTTTTSAGAGFSGPPAATGVRMGCVTGTLPNAVGFNRARYWLRALSNTEINWLAAEPYAMYREIRKRVYSLPIPVVGPTGDAIWFGMSF